MKLLRACYALYVDLLFYFIHKIGEFGIVYKASLVHSKENSFTEKSVAVKTLKGVQ